MIENKLPLVSEVNGFKLKKLGFEWKVNYYHMDAVGLTSSITESGDNYNRENIFGVEYSRYCSIPIIDLAIRWLEMEYEIYISKDWVNMNFSFIDYSDPDNIDDAYEIDIMGEGFETPDDSLQYILGAALDYLIMAIFPMFGDVVILTNNRIGRCIGNYKAIYIESPPRNMEVGDVDIEALKIHGKNFKVKNVAIPSYKDIKQFKIPEPKTKKI